MKEIIYLWLFDRVRIQKNRKRRKKVFPSGKMVMDPVSYSDEMRGRENFKGMTLCLKWIRNVVLYRFQIGSFRI